MTDVLVVGAGPVGLTLAVDLARRGIAVRIIDTLAAPTTESRAIVLHSRSLDYLQALGALDALAARGVVATGMVFHSGDRDIAEVDFTRIDADHRYSLSVPQTDTEEVFTARLAELGVHVERDATLTGFTEEGETVVATVTDAAGATSVIRASYLVGTDGARSAVRHLTGQKLEGSFHGEDFLLGDIEGEHDYDRSRFHTFFSPRTPTGLIFPLRGTRDRVFAQLPDGTDPDRPVTVEWLQQELDARGMQIRITEAHWLTRLRLKYGQVERYRTGRVFLAGDAAHIHTPAGGLGMNTGIQDATNLSWKLAAVVRGAPDALLDSYGAERHPVGAGVIEFTNRLAKMGTLKNPVAQHARNLAMHLAFGIPFVGEKLADTVEQQTIRYRDSPIVSGGHGEVRAGDFLELPGVADALAAAPGHLAVRLGDAEVTLPDGVTWLDTDAADAVSLAKSTGVPNGVVLVRPDRYIGYVGQADGIRGYFATVAG
jgi:2-polyprenyl-6-methoxyphenol hydroxylase-like FAD-dependent oxidoreductase